MIVFTIIGLCLAGGLISFFPFPKAFRSVLALFVSAVVLYYSITALSAGTVTVSLPLTVMGTTLGFMLSPLSVYFILMIASLTFLTVLFSMAFMKKKDKWNGSYYGWLFLKNAGMIGVVSAGDFITLFLAWEFMSWTTFFFMQEGEEKNVVASSSKYLTYAIISGMTLMFAVGVVYSQTGSLTYGALITALPAISPGTLLLMVSLFLVAFGIEAAAYPMHLWVPDSYANTYSPITAFLAGISTRMGIFAIIFVLFGIIGIDHLDRLTIIGKINFRYILGWIAAFTIVIPTYTALLQNDGKKLMTWHGIGQGGYMLLGLATGSSLGIAGGIFHIVNYLTYIVLILLSLAAVEYRTGTTNLNRLGGLLKKQPVAYLGVLTGIIGLAGIPPMNGFVSKWFIYKALIEGHYPFLAAAAFIGTLGTILSVYKFIHNIFLGQLPKEYENIKEAPLPMTIPIVVLMAAVYGLGVFPGVVLSIIANIQATVLHSAPIQYSLYGIDSLKSGNLNMNIVNIVFIIAFFVGFLVYLLGSRSRKVSQYNTYAAGHFIDEQIDYNFNYHFYAAMEHLIKKKLFADISYKIEGGTKKFFESVGDYIKGIYTGNAATYAMYVVATLVLLIALLGSQYGL